VLARKASQRRPPRQGRHPLLGGTVPIRSAAPTSELGMHPIATARTRAWGRIIRRHVLVPFGESDAMADATLRFLTDPVFQMETRRRAQQTAVRMDLETLRDTPPASRVGALTFIFAPPEIRPRRAPGDDGIDVDNLISDGFSVS